MTRFLAIPAACTLFLIAACAGSQAQPKTGDQPPAEAKNQIKDIVDTAVGAGQFTTLVKALQAAELVDTLRGDGPFTVFAPNDDAFAKLPAGTVESLLQDKEKLTQVLTYHVVAGKVMAAQVGGMQSAKTLQGGSLAIDTSSGVRVGGANVVATDIDTKNGVIHVIDTVLIPE